MFAFVLYAIAVWWFAAVYRRRWPAFLAVGLGLIGLLLVNYLHTRLYVWTEGAILLPVLRHLMYPYTALVVGAGLYAACLPRRMPDGTCAACGYNLQGLPHTRVPVCPECGEDLSERDRIVRPIRRTEHRTLFTYRRDAKARQAAGQRRAGPPSGSSEVR